MQNIEKIRSIKSNWSEAEIVSFFNILDSLLKTYGVPSEFEVKRFWLAILHRHDSATVMDALLKIFDDKIYGRPTPDLVIQKIKGGPTEALATGAWVEVLTAIRKIGPYNSVEFSSARIAASVKRLGWHNLCAMTEGYELDKAAKDFKDIFQIMESDPSEPTVVLGYSDLDRQGRGLPVRQAVKTLNQTREADRLGYGYQ